MKRLWISCLIILLLAGLCGLHIMHLQSLTDKMIQGLETVDTHLERKEWSSAQRLTLEIYEDFERQAFFLHTTLRHADIDGIRNSLKEVMAYLNSHEDPAECRAANAKLINQLELLLEAELPSIKNLL